MDAVLLRSAPAQLPPALQPLLQGAPPPASVTFAPLRRAGLGGALLAAVLLGTPALLVLLAVLWTATQLSLGPLALLVLVLLAAVAALVLVAQLLRVQQARQRVRAQRARLQGHEGLYVDADAGWLMLVSPQGHVSLLGRDSLRHVREVRVTYRRSRSEAFCMLWPAVELHDGRQVLLQTPPLTGDPSLEDLLLLRWQIPAIPGRQDISEAGLRDFLLL